MNNKNLMLTGLLATSLIVSNNNVRAEQAAHMAIETPKKVVKKKAKKYLLMNSSFTAETLPTELVGEYKRIVEQTTKKLERECGTLHMTKETIKDYVAQGLEPFCTRLNNIIFEDNIKSAVDQAIAQFLNEQAFNEQALPAQFSASYFEHKKNVSSRVNRIMMQRSKRYVHPNEIDAAVNNELGDLIHQITAHENAQKIFSHNLEARVTEIMNQQLAIYRVTTAEMTAMLPPAAVETYEHALNAIFTTLRNKIATHEAGYVSTIEAEQIIAKELAPVLKKAQEEEMKAQQAAMNSLQNMYGNMQNMIGM